MLELSTLYRRVSISNTDTHTHQTDCHINVHVVCIDCNVYVVFALLEVIGGERATWRTDRMIFFQSNAIVTDVA